MTKRTLFNDGWRFAKYPFGTKIEEIKVADFKEVSIPHDWLIYNSDDLYEDGTGFYVKEFEYEPAGGRYASIYFEGVYMDTTVYINGSKAYEWKYGYSSFFFDMTSFLKNGKNTVTVKVDHKSPNTRWYSGAGIFRDVFLIEKDGLSFATDGVYISERPAKECGAKETPDSDWIVTVSAELTSECGRVMTADEVRNIADIYEIGFSADGLGDCRKKVSECEIDKNGVTFTVTVNSPKLWSTEEANLYNAEVYLLKDGSKTESLCQKIGFRNFVFTNDEGFFVNGKHLKINGVCEHHDLGALGAAFNKSAMRRKLEILRQMGVNGIRTSHNMPAVGLLELTDEMGFVVMDEAFDMWRRPKTEFDYARFFDAWQERDVESWIRRDRNHASIAIWSIGNEIYDTHADENAPEITRMLMDEVKVHDFRGNAVVSMASNYMPWVGAQNCADVLKYIGYNYNEKQYDDHHKDHPDWFIYGSETSSTVQSRGIYHFPYSQTTLADDDEQCSALGNCVTSWGAPNTEYCIIAERDHEFSAGQFLWTGFDYIGEPTPYHTRNSYFGQIDLAGFPKDQFYIYKSGWTDAADDPFVHIFPYWDWNIGQIIDVRIASNAPCVELFLNGKSLGKKNIDHVKGDILTGNWKVTYEPGEITAVAYDGNGKEIARESEHSFGEAKRIVMSRYMPEREIKSGSGDVAFITIEVLDKDGYPVRNANNMINVKVSGAGYLTGLDNGDSTDTEGYKCSYRRLFGGKLLAMVKSTDEAGKVTVCAEGKGLVPAEMIFEILPDEKMTGASYTRETLDDNEPASDRSPWIRKIELVTDGERKLTADKKSMRISAKILPEEADTPEARKGLIWRAVTDSGVDTNLAKIKTDSDGNAEITALGDGSFRVRCMTKNGAAQVKVISCIEFANEGIGDALLDPYGFIPGVMWTLNEGELGNGNEHGVGTMRDGRTVIGFENVDFGEFGSDEITIPVFELGGKMINIEIWDGFAGEPGSEMLLDAVYHKPSIWNTYQPETYRLKRRMKGVRTISFVTTEKIHIKGFSFTRQEKAFSILDGNDAENMYGDSYKKEGSRITGIGNNVTIDFGKLEFGDEGATKIAIKGYTPNDINTIHLVFGDGTGNRREMIEFPHTEKPDEIVFEINKITGDEKVQLVFLPGSNFDLEYIVFRKE